MHQSRFISLSLVVMASTVALALSPITTPSTTAPQDSPAQTAQHKNILEGVGEWVGTMTMTMPGMEKSVVPAKETVTAVGKLWTHARFECPFMGQAYIGTGCLGYDVAQKKVVGTWLDSFSTEIAHMVGEMDMKTKAITLRWKATDPQSGKKIPHRSVTTFTKNSYTATFFMGKGEGTQSMVIAMQRRPKVTSTPSEKKSRR